MTVTGGGTGGRTGGGIKPSGGITGEALVGDGVAKTVGSGVITGTGACVGVEGGRVGALTGEPVGSCVES